MLPYLVARARWTTFALLVACSFDSSGLDSAGPPSSNTTTTTGEPTTTTGGPSTLSPPTTGGPVGSVSDSDSDSTTSTTTPVDPTDATSTSTSTSTSTDSETTATTEPDDTSTSTSTTTTTTTGPDMTTGPMCNDFGPEPNENEGSAVDLGEQHCKASPQKFYGVLDGDSDIDWFRFHGDFSGGGCGATNPDPTAKITVTVASPLEVCMYADCDADGDTNFSCPGGTSGATSPDGRKGCCGPGSMQYKVDCEISPNESAVVFVRLSGAEADACLQYEVEYSYRN